MSNLRTRHNQFVKSTKFSQPNVVMRYGYEQMQSVSIQGGGLAVPSQRNEMIKQKVYQGSSYLTREGTFDFTPVDAFPVATDCNCLRLDANNLRERERSNSFDKSLAARFYSVEVEDPAICPSANESDDENDEGLQLPVILKTFSRFSSRHLNPLQAKSISRLAKGYHGKDQITTQYASQLSEFLECESPAIQEASLITLARLIEKGEDNDEILYNNFHEILDSVLSLASDGPTLEVHVAALMVVEKITKSEKNIAKWERQLEDIVYPLVHAIVKNRESSQAQKMGSLAIMRNLSRSSLFAVRVKQDVVSQLMSVFDNSQMKGLYLSVLHETLQLSKQRVSADILDNSLLPVLTSMLADGSCDTQRQSLLLLLYFVEEEASRSSVLSNANTTAFCILCAKHSQCRKVRALSVRILEQFFSIKFAAQARNFMQCVSDAWVLEGMKSSGSKPLVREERVSSPVRRKSRAEAQLWSDFDKLVIELVKLMEKEASIYHDQNKVSCELSLIGSINPDQLVCIASLVGCVTKLCLWPLQRPRTSVSAIGDVPDRLSLDVLNLTTSVNRHHTVDVWHRTGPQLMSLFKQVLKRIPNSCPPLIKPTPDSSNHLSSTKTLQAWTITSDTKQHMSPTSDERSNSSKQNKATSQPEPLHLKHLLSQEEYSLLTSLTYFVFVMSLATCAFKEMPTGDSQTQEREGQKVTKKNSERMAKEDVLEKEILMERKDLKCDLIEKGIIAFLGHLLAHDDDDIKVLCTASLRMLLLPIYDRGSSTSKQTSYVSRNVVGNTRPQSAKARLEGSRRQTLSPRVFDMGRPGLGSRPQSSIPYLTSRSRPSSARPASSLSKTPQYILSDGPGHPPSRPSSASRTKFGQFSPLTPRSESKPLNVRTGGFSDPGEHNGTSGSLTDRTNDLRSLKNVSFNDNITHFMASNGEELVERRLDTKSNVSLQCCQRALRVAGEATLKGIFSQDVEVKKSCLMFLHDLVKYGTNEIHMDLAKLGCVVRLVDFLRINDDDELLEIIGLIISRMLISSDRRLCQLFNRHGGTNILMALLKKHPGTELTREACSTLNSVNNILHQPADGDEEGEGRPRDVWEHIMQRWEEEDEVVKVLKQFLKK